MKKVLTKRNVAKGIGAGIVGVVGGVAIKELLGTEAAGSLLGAALLMVAHEAFNAPVSKAVYRNI